MNDCLADANGDRVLNSAEYAPALWGEHVATAKPLPFALPSSQSACNDKYQQLRLAHFLMALDADQRTKLTILYNELRRPDTPVARKDIIRGTAQVRGELETLLEDAVTQSLKVLPARMQANLAQAEANKLPQPALDNLKEAAARLKEITSRFDKVDFDPKHVEDIASHFVQALSSSPALQR